MLRRSLKRPHVDDGSYGPVGHLIRLRPRSRSVKTDIDGKHVLVRADLNVPLDNGQGRRRHAYPRRAPYARDVAKPRSSIDQRLLAPWAVPTTPPKLLDCPGLGLRLRELFDSSITVAEKTQF